MTDELDRPALAHHATPVSPWRPFKGHGPCTRMDFLRGFGVALFWIFGGWIAIAAAGLVLGLIGVLGDPASGGRDILLYGAKASPIAIVMTLIGFTVYLPWLAARRLRALPRRWAVSWLAGLAGLLAAQMPGTPYGPESFWLPLALGATLLCTLGGVAVLGVLPTRKAADPAPLQEAG